MSFGSHYSLFRHNGLTVPAGVLWIEDHQAAKGAATDYNKEIKDVKKVRPLNIFVAQQAKQRQGRIPTDGEEQW